MVSIDLSNYFNYAIPMTEEQTKMYRTKMTAVSLFAGVGGFDLALERNGVKVVASVEIDKHASSVLAKKFPNSKLFTDVREVTGDDLRSAGFIPEHGIITGGFPCQDLSVAGKRAGLAGQRSGLFYEIARLADETKAEWLVLENVPGLLTSQRGADMGAVVGTLVEFGYGVAWRVLDAQHFGVPQRRRRVFIVARRSGDPASAAKVLFERESLRGNYPASGTQGQETAGSTGQGATYPINTLTLGGRPDPANDRRMTIGVGDDGDPQFTLQANHSHAVAIQGVTYPIQDGRGIEKSQNGLGIGSEFDPSYTVDTTGAQSVAIQGSMIGRSDNAGPGGKGYGELDDPMFTLNTTDRHAVAIQGDTYPIGFSHTQGLDAQPSTTAFPTLRSNGGGHAVADIAATLRSGGDGGVPSSRGEHLVIDPVAFDEMNFTTTEMHQTLRAGTPQSTGVVEPTIYEPHHGDGRQTTGVVNTLAARMGTGGNTVPVLVEPVMDIVGPVTTGMSSPRGTETSDSGHLVVEQTTWWNGGDIAASLTVSSDDQRMPDKGNFQAIIEATNVVRQDD